MTLSECDRRFEKYSRGVGIYPGNPKGGATGKRPANPFASFFSGPYGNDSTAPKPSFTFNFGIPKTQRIINQSFDFKKPVSYHFYRVNISAKCAEDWRFGSLDLKLMSAGLI